GGGGGGGCGGGGGGAGGGGGGGAGGGRGRFPAPGGPPPPAGRAGLPQRLSRGHQTRGASEQREQAPRNPRRADQGAPVGGDRRRVALPAVPGGQFGRDGGRDRRWLVRRADPTEPPVLRDTGQAGDGGADHRPPERQHLTGHQRAPFPARGNHDRPTPRYQIAQALARLHPEQPDPRQLGRQPSEVVVRPFARDQHLGPPVRGQAPDHAGQEGGVLLRRVPAPDRNDPIRPIGNDRAVTIAARHRVREPRQPPGQAARAEPIEQAPEFAQRAFAGERQDVRRRRVFDERAVLRGGAEQEPLEPVLCRSEFPTKRRRKVGHQSEGRPRVIQGAQLAVRLA